MDNNITEAASGTNTDDSIQPKSLPLLPVKEDFIFKLIFGDQRNVDILTAFLMSILDIPKEEYDYLTIVDPYVKKDFEEDKYGILDVKLHTKSGFVVHIDIQVNPIPEMIHRVIYYHSKLITEQIASGDGYKKIRRTISIIITNFTLVKNSSKYYRRFLYRDEDGIEFTNLTEFVTLELNKLPSNTDDSDLWYWTKFISTEGDDNVMEMLQERSPQMRKAVGVLKELSADERNRMIIELREKARRDQASREEGAEQKGLKEGRKEGRKEGLKEGRKEQASEIARNAIKMDIGIDTIIKLTGLSREEIEELR